jgi:hypothetical protein
MVEQKSMLKPAAASTGSSPMGASICLAARATESSLRCFSHGYYNPASDTWHSLEPMPIAVHGVPGLAFIDGSIHLPGGGTAQGGSSGSTIHQVYRPGMSCR